MIFVDGRPFPASSSSQSQSQSESQSQSQSRGSGTLVESLMEHPSLVSASHTLKSMKEWKCSFPQAQDEDGDDDDSSNARTHKHRRWVYVFQREYATVEPAHVDFVGTDEATTCVGLVIRNRRTGMISVAHMDSTKIVDIGLTQMLSLVTSYDSDANLDVHIVGGFEDVSPKHFNVSSGSKSHGKLGGYSLPLCTKIIETLRWRPEKFHIQTLFVLRHNTKRDSQGNACPILTGFVVETSSGSLKPASFDSTARCPDEIVRRIRVTASYEDLTWNGRLLETYDTEADCFVISPCTWTKWQLYVAQTLQNLCDAEILLECSTSPYAEGPDFVDNLRRQWEYLMKYPDWKDSFPMKQPRIFERTADGGGWKRRGES